MIPVDGSNGLNTAASLKTPARSWFTIGVISIPVIIAALYIPALDGEFLGWDDIAYLGDPVLDAPFGDAVRVSFETPYWRGWYPLLRILFWTEVVLAGKSSFFFHTVNLVLFLANTLLLSMLLRRMGLSRLVAYFAVMLWSIHPLRIESVAWISSQKDMLSLFFILLSSSVALPPNERRPGAARLVLAHLLFAMSLLSKSLVMPISLFLWIWASYRFDWREATRRFGGYILLALVDGLIALWALGSLGAQAYPGDNALDSLLIALHFHGDWIVRILFPVGLSAIYPIPENPLPMAVGWTILIAAFTSLAVWKMRRGDSRLVVMIAAWIIPLLPVSGIVPLSFWGADRYTLISSIAISVAVGFGLSLLISRSKILGVAVSVVLFISLAGATRDRIPDWHDSIALWETDLQRPGSHYVRHLNLGGAYGASQRYDLALEQFKEAHRLEPGNCEILAHLVFTELVVKGLDQGRGRAARLLEPPPRTREEWMRIEEILISAEEGGLAAMVHDAKEVCTDSGGGSD